jgi:cyclophilin family peptidyl-prolyl cis-trans isomerase
MTQKHVLMLLLLIVIGGLIATGINKLQKDSTVMKTTPTPTPGTLNFNQGQQNAAASNNQPQQRKQYSQFPGTYPQEQLQNKVAVLDTTAGQIVFSIDPEAPKAASNFIFLSLEGFYNGLTFHRVEPGFVIQGGDPVGNGTGGPGYKFEDEPVNKSYTKGIVAMANSGPNTNGSQFFIMLEDAPSLPPNYTIFGNVIQGQEVVSKIKVGDVIKSVTIQNASQ